MTRPTADHADQTYTVSHAAAGLVPATVGASIVATHAESQRTETGKNNV